MGPPAREDSKHDSYDVVKTAKGDKWIPSNFCLKGREIDGEMLRNSIGLVAESGPALARPLAASPFLIFCLSSPT